MNYREGEPALWEIAILVHQRFGNYMNLKEKKMGFNVWSADKIRRLSELAIGDCLKEIVGTNQTPHCEFVNVIQTSQ